MSDIDGVNSFWIQARAEWESERTALANENARLRAATALLEDLQNGKTTVHACNILRDIKEILAVKVIL